MYRRRVGKNRSKKARLLFSDCRKQTAFIRALWWNCVWAASSPFPPDDLLIIHQLLHCFVIQTQISGFIVSHQLWLFLEVFFKHSTVFRSFNAIAHINVTEKSYLMYFVLKVLQCKFPANHTTSLHCWNSNPGIAPTHTHLNQNRLSKKRTCCYHYLPQVALHPQTNLNFKFYNSK